MKTSYDVILVMPIGPSCKEEHIVDSLNSFIYYTRSDFKIILADDSHKGTASRIKKIFPFADVVTTTNPHGKLCGLYITLSMAFAYAIKNYSFKMALRMDTDALIIGREPEKEALNLFASHPDIGIAGQYPLDYNGWPWDNSWPKKVILKQLRTYYFFKRPIANILLYIYYRRAINKGYLPGENVFGGAYFISESCLYKLKKAGLLPNKLLKNIKLEEDHLFSLLIKMIGMRFGDLSSSDLPLACAWKGLPASPEELLAKGKKIIHSTRFWKNLNEDEIRNYFMLKRKITEKSTSYA